MARTYELPLTLQQVATMRRLKAFAEQEVESARALGHLHSVNAWVEVRDNLGQHLEAHERMVSA